MKKALITGAAGQDGSYMCDLLISKGYEVHGLVRPSGNREYPYLTALHAHGKVIWGDLLDSELFEVLSRNGYDEVYHFAAVSHVATSFANPALTMETNLTATSRLLAAFYRNSPDTKIYIAGTSEMYGQSQLPPYQYGRSNREFEPCSPYGVSKLAAHQLAQVYRQMGMFVVRGIAYNHESSRRGPHFVTRKIGLSLRETGKVTLGNVTAMRDWHHASDTVWGIWLSLQAAVASDYVFASGIARSVEEFARAACTYFGLEYEKVVTVSSSGLRPLDISYLCGDYSYTQQALGWSPAITFENLVEDCCASKQEHSAFRL